MSFSPPATPFAPLPVPPPAPPSAPLHDNPSQAVASQAGFTEGFPLALLQPGWGFHSGLLPGPSLPLPPASSVPLFGEPSPFSDYSAVADHLLRLQASAPASPPATLMAAETLQPLSQAAEPLPPLQEDPAATAALVAAVGDTTQLTTALATFLASILAALSQLLADLQAAITDNPALALLLLLPLFLLLLLHLHWSHGYGGHHGGGYGGGYGGGGGYHGRRFVTPHHVGIFEATDELVRHVVAAIERGALGDSPLATPT